MKKLLVVLMVLALASPAMAASMVTVSGSYDVVGVATENMSDQNARRADTAVDDNVNFVYQRFRVQPVIKASDSVSGTLRFDFAEGQWGQDQDFTTQRDSDTGISSEFQVDRAFVDVNMDYVSIRAGLQFIYAGQTQVFRDNQPGLQLNIKTGSPVGIRLAWIKVDEGIGRTTATPDFIARLSDDADENKDTDRYLGDISFNTDAVKLNLFYVMQSDGSSNGTTNFKDEPNVLGLRFRSAVGPVAISGEVATFGGDNGNGTDYTGTQANVNGMMKISDALSVGLDLIYSTSQGSGETKLTYMGNPFARYDVEAGGTMGWDMLTYGQTNAPVFATFPPGGAIPGDVFDPFQTGAGDICAGIGVKFIPMDKLTLIGQFHYMTAADDDISGVTGEFSSGYNLLVAAVYQLRPKASLHATYQYVDADFSDDLEVDSSYMATLRLHIDF